MRSRQNHDIMKSNEGLAHFYGEGVTTENWPLVVGTSCFIPLLLDARGHGKVSDHKAAEPALLIVPLLPLVLLAVGLLKGSCLSLVSLIRLSLGFVNPPRIADDVCDKRWHHSAEPV